MFKTEEVLSSHQFLTTRGVPLLKNSSIFILDINTLHIFKMTVTNFVLVTELPFVNMLFVVRFAVITRYTLICG